MSRRALAALEPATVHLFCSDAREIDADVRNRYLLADDFARLPAIARPARRTQYLAARALLRFALQQCAGLATTAQHLRTTAGGKSECVGGPAISVAHDGHIVVCAIAEHAAVGVDVQTSSNRRSTEAIAAQHFCSAEIEWLRDCPPERFYMLWVLKEAYLKAMGVGLAGGLDALECRVDPPLIHSRPAPANPPASLALYRCAGAYLGVAALDSRSLRVRVERWHPQAPGQPAFGVPDLVAATS